MDKQKKQMMTMGVLLLVLVAVGAFQFMGPKPAAPTTDAAATTSEPAATEETGVVINDGANPGAAVGEEGAADKAADPLVANQLPVRDPFMPTASAARAAQETAEAGSKTAQPVNPPQAPTHSSQQPSRLAGNPGGMQNFSSPYDPLPGTNHNGIGLPPVGGNGEAPPTNLEPAKRSGYKVVGTIVGKSKMVVLEDPDGNQVLVPEGKKTPDGKARVVGVQKGKAKVSQEGQVKMLGLEEE